MTYTSEQFRPLRTPMVDCLAQCVQCGATFSVDMVDAITGVPLIHKPADDPRYITNPCGGTVRLFQEVRYDS